MHIALAILLVLHPAVPNRRTPVGAWILNAELSDAGSVAPLDPSVEAWLEPPSEMGIRLTKAVVLFYEQGRLRSVQKLLTRKLAVPADALSATRAYWDGTVLRVEQAWPSGLRARRTYTVDAEGRLIVATAVFKGGTGHATRFRQIYDRIE